MSHPVCPNCRLPIQPGSSVDIVTVEDLEEARIIASGDAIIKHVACPDRPTLRTLQTGIEQIAAKYGEQALDWPLQASTTLETPLSEMSNDGVVQWINRLDTYLAGTPVGAFAWPEENPEFIVLHVNEGTDVRSQQRIEELGGGG